MAGKAGQSEYRAVTSHEGDVLLGVLFYMNLGGPNTWEGRRE